MEIILDYFNDFEPQQIQQLEQLGSLYQEWNQKINVISRKDIDALYEKHVLHSLAIAATVQFNPGARVIDIGTGGGFPGIPLAIFFPEVQFHLVDSIGKKLKVVSAVAEALGLKNVTITHTRAEALTRNTYDFAVSRAVAPLGTLWQWAKPLLRVGHNSEDYGNGLVCLKGGDLAQEFAESGLRPRLLPITQVFNEPYFEEKYLVYVPR